MRFAYFFHVFHQINFTRWPAPPESFDILKTLAKRCLHMDPDSRPTAEDFHLYLMWAFKHPNVKPNEVPQELAVFRESKSTRGSSDGSSRR